MVKPDNDEIILFLGNCQIGVISKYCSFYLKKKIEYLNIVLDLTNHSEKVDDLIKNANIIVRQNFYNEHFYYNNNKINELKNKNSYVLSVHGIYYDGYFPYINIKEYDNLENKQQKMDLIIENSNKSLENLFNRENGINDFNKIDIPIYEFIKNNYKKRRLLLRENHPTNYVMNYYAYLIYERIIHDKNYFDQTKSLYNEKFDNSIEELNDKKTYLLIDEITKESLNIEW